MRCPNCGAIVNDSDISCKYCGVMLPATEIYLQNKTYFTENKNVDKRDISQITQSKPTTENRPYRPPYSNKVKKSYSAMLLKILIILLSFDMLFDFVTLIAVLLNK